MRKRGLIFIEDTLLRKPDMNNVNAFKVRLMEKSRVVPSIRTGDSAEMVDSDDKKRPGRQ